MSAGLTNRPRAVTPEPGKQHLSEGQPCVYYSFDDDRPPANKMVVYSFYIFDRHSMRLSPFLETAAMLITKQRNVYTRGSGLDKTDHYHPAGQLRDLCPAPAQRAVGQQRRILGLLEHDRRD